MNTIQGYTPQTNSESPLSSILSTPGLTLEKLPHELPEPPPKKVSCQTLMATVGPLGLLVVSEFHFLSKCTAKKSPTGARYCYPSEKYLAKRFGVARETISRCITRLARLGIISVTHRRKRAGRWQTNLYKIINFCWWPFQKFLSDIIKVPRRVTKTSHKEVPMRDNNELILPKRIGESAKALLDTWMKRGETPKDPA